MSYEGRKPSSFPRNCAQLNIWTLRHRVLLENAPKPKEGVRGASGRWVSTPSGDLVRGNNHCKSATVLSVPELYVGYAMKIADSTRAAC